MMEFQQLILSCLLGGVVSVSMITLILQLENHFCLSHRNAELHQTQWKPKSRLGGVALAVAFISVLLLFAALNDWHFQFGAMRWKIMVASLAMFGLGLMDDLFLLGAKRKLVGQVLIATAAFLFGIGIHHLQIPFTDTIIDLGFWSGPVTVFWLVAMTNLINLIDGVDGLAGGICLMLMLLMAYVGSATGAVSFVAAGMVGALLGFLRFNFPPARIYMGDGGAYFLGFLIGSMTIVSSQKGTIFAALTAPLFVMALPILDTSLAILRRGLRGLPLFRPDRSHIHHHLLEAGLSRRQVVLGLYGFTAFFLSLGFFTFWLRGHYLPIFAGLGTLVILLVAGKLNFSREWFAVGRVVGNSLAMRAEIQYALAQTRWLAMEGTRCESLADLCEDAAFIARKLGYAHVRIRLEDDERTWQLIPLNKMDCCRFQHKLPGHPYCFLEVDAPRAGSAAGARMMSERSFEILSELLAEGWAKSICIWEKHYRRPVRFDAREIRTPQIRSGQIPAIQTAST